MSTSQAMIFLFVRPKNKEPKFSFHKPHYFKNLYFYTKFLSHSYYYTFHQKYQRYITNEIFNSLSETDRSFKDIQAPFDRLSRLSGLSLLDLKLKEWGYQ